jgi:hypothetical protein
MTGRSQMHRDINSALDFIASYWTTFPFDRYDVPMNGFISEEGLDSVLTHPKSYYCDDSLVTSLNPAATTD